MMESMFLLFLSIPGLVFAQPLLTLSSIDTASQSHSSVLEAEKRAEQTGIDRSLLQRQWWPSVFVQGAWWQHESVGMPRSVSVHAKTPLYAPGLLRQEQLTSLQQRVALLHLKKAKRDARQRARFAFLEAMRCKAQQLSLEATYQYAQAVEQREEYRYQCGAVPALHVLNARRFVLQSRHALLEQQRQLNAACRHLALQLGQRADSIHPHQIVLLALSRLIPPRALNFIPDASPKRTLSYAIYRVQKEQLTQRDAGSFDPFLPQVHAAYTKVYHTFARQENTGVGVTWDLPLWQQPILQRSKVLVEKTLLQAAWRSQKEQMQRMQANSLAQWHTTLHQKRLAQASASYAKEHMYLEKMRQKLGSGASIEFLDAKRHHCTALFTLTEAQLAIAAAWYTIADAYELE